MSKLLKYIKNVSELNSEYYLIEHTYLCQTQKESATIKKIKLSKEIIESEKNPICGNHSNYFCEYLECPLIIAAREWLEISKKEPPKKPIERLKEYNQEVYDEITKVKNLPTEVIDWFITIILNNKISNNWNIALWDSADTFFNISKYQEHIIETYLNIIAILNKRTYSKIHYINCIDYSVSDLFNDIDADVYVFSNIYGLNTSYELVKKETTYIQYDYQINLTKYILENIPKNKVFILCDKAVNGHNFFNNFSQLKSLFMEYTVTDLPLGTLQKYALDILSQNNVEVNRESKEEFKEYLEKEYLYSPYKNYDFIYFLQQLSIGNTLVVSDLPKFNNKKNYAEMTLDKLVGLENIKNEINELKGYLSFQQEKKKKGDTTPDIDLHMAFLGNPGTGKTTVARLMANILFNLGYIRYDKCLEIEAKDLISEGEISTSTKTATVIQKALGGVLFIDEAYAIMENKHGAECIATLIKSMEDYRDDLVVILAGYNDEMNKFFSINSGFDSRITYKMKFHDYTIDELLEISENLLKEYGMKFDGFNTKEKLKNYYVLKKRSLQKNFGNSRFVRNTVEKIMKQHAINTTIYIDSLDEEEQKLRREYITSEDIRDDFS